MDEASKGVIDALSSHERREQAKRERELAREHKEAFQQEKARKKQNFWIIVALLVIVAFAAGIWWLYTHKPETYTDREVHWHAYIDINICGEKVELPCNVETPGIVHGGKFCGEHLLHHHYDNILHIEGLIRKKEDIALGRFFDLIGVPFSAEKILDKQNGDLCPDGRPGKWKMYVNEQPRTDFRDYVPFAVADARKQVIKLVFEPEGGMTADNTNKSS
ncbi:MAG: hypothetical protein QW165_03360 [Candidatus Woesearchaeota archaeon]